ncbi:MAG: chromosome segregation protein SMC, partial [Thiothrix sp.]|nr:chromosome segregation protein SMC [Thiothrix sp.]
QGRQEQQSLQRDWEAEWWPLGIRPAEPPVMKQWLARVDSLLAGVREARLAQAQVTHLAADHTAHRQTLAVQLADGNPAAEKNTPQADLPSLSTLLAACEQGIEQEEQRRNRQVQWQQACDEASERIDRQQDSLATIEAHLATWGEEWQQAIAGLGLGTQAHPEEALETLEQLALFFEKYDASEEKRRRLWGMDKDRDEFGEQVFAFAAGIGCDCTGQPPERIAEQLYQGLSQAREARAKLEKMRDAEKVTREALHEADITRQAAQQRLAELQALAQVSDEAGLQQAGEQSGARRTLQRQLEALEQELRRNGDGLTLAALEQEAAVVDLDTAAAALEPVDGVLDALYRQRDSLRDQRQTLQNRMEAQAGGAAAADAAEEAEQHLASLSAGAEQYLRLKIAALMLGQRIEAYRQQNQAPVLSRAGGLFACLTLDAYAGLRDELGTDDKPVLLGLRPDN